MDPSEIRLWAETVAMLMADTENRLIRVVCNSAWRDMGADPYAVKRLAELALVRARLEKQLGRSWDDVINRVQDVLNLARQAGQGAANWDLKRSTMPDTLPAQMALGIERIAADTLKHLVPMRAIILRDAIDQYQQVISGPAVHTLTGATSRREATKEAMRRFARRGIQGFTDKSGRAWRLDSYAEMAVRTGAMHAARYGYEQTLINAGEDLVTISSHGYTCSMCAKWEGKTLSLTGRTPTGTSMMEHALLDGVMVPVTVSGTVEQARAEGLFHPNCGHTAALYLPGVTRPSKPAERKSTYDASQQQRAEEVHIRALKRQLAGEFDPAKQTQIRREINQHRQNIRDLIEKHPMLKRKRERERNLMGDPKPPKVHTD